MAEKNNETDNNEIEFNTIYVYEKKIDCRDGLADVHGHTHLGVLDARRV